MDSPSDISLLKEILRELKLPEKEIDTLVDDLEDDPQDLNTPGTDGMEDSSIEDEKEKQIQSNTKPELEPESKEEPQNTQIGDEQYDAVIRAHLGLNDDQPLPRVKGTYPWPGKGGATFDIQVKGDDLKYWKDFWTLTPPKAGGEIGDTSKGSGNGELSLYWLYQHSNSADVKGTQGSDNPDLEFNGIGVEVKDYGDHSKVKGLGRWSQDKPQLDALGILFGFQKLIVALEPKSSGKFPPDVSPNNFKGFQLVQAFEVLQQLLDVDLEGLGQEYSLFLDIKKRLDSLKQKIGDWDSPEDGARKMAVYFVEPKIGRKPGDGGFLVNVQKGGNCRFYGIDKEKLLNHPNLIGKKGLSGYIGSANSQMYLDFNEFFM
tara:strand:- start:445 stop:1566 length:1122 start_codon:yes stop_codon:yes gene_type:complete